mmetsp:Transcript_54211/g.126560  ORF Transcript_54211/g.126560 Transcript_54211/m.126560 type:complete len:300 (+) Transcript_54211:120-1019(+)
MGNALICCGGTQKAWGSHYKFNVMILSYLDSRSGQMAEAWLRHLRGDLSVGVATAGILGGNTADERAVAVMKEVGIDMSSFASTSMSDFSPEDFDAVIFCSHSGGELHGEGRVWKTRPIFMEKFDDPAKADPGDLSAYRRIRDETKAKVQELLDVLSKPYGPQYKHNVLFLCDYNNLHSQMAEGWLRSLREKHSIGVASAATNGPTPVKEDAIKVMGEAGIDISNFSSDAVGNVNVELFQAVIHCGGILWDEHRNVFKKRPYFAEWRLKDIPEDLSDYRQIRDETKAKVLRLIGDLTTG